MMNRLRVVVPLAGMLALAAFTQRDGVQAALDGITAAGIRGHLQFLSHDLLEGRAPGTRGGDLAAQYIAAQFARAGLQPVRGTYFQPVALVGTTIQAPGSPVLFQQGDSAIRAVYRRDLVHWLPSGEREVSVEGELVFVGYGIRAPEHRWDDFGGRDLSGRILLILAGEPPAPPEEPDLFAGRALTYYGRWTYKLEEARRQGAAGALIIHTAESAGYSWSVVESSWTGEQFALPRGHAADRQLALEGWITQPFGYRVLAVAGLNLDDLTVQAARRDFRPVATGLRVHASLQGATRQLATANVVGVVPGRHPERRGDVVVFTAHYDHLGIGQAVDGDSIYNGAYDNASGVAVLIEMAAAFSRLASPPDRSVLFLATTAEEAGLLGATHYVQQPLYPLSRTMAVLNIDGANLWGETEDAVIMGAERSTLGRFARDAADAMRVRLVPDPSPEKGFFYRSDHFPFARAGVPALAVEHGVVFRGRPDGWGVETLARYEAERYHRPADRYDPAFDLTGAVQQARLAFLIGLGVATSPDVPEWHEGTEFRTAWERSRARSPR
jgi:Zn-dependent M28 family amino/carboxypeptidase